MSKHFEIIVGTMLGAAEYVADAIAEKLDASGHTHTIHAEPNLDEIKTESTWIVCTSTHGAGELPDNIQPFAKQLEGADLSAVNAYVIGLGDTSYDTFCFGAKEMEKHIKNAGGTLITDALYIDVLEHPIPEDAAVEWFDEKLANA
ncbi:FMN-binding protein MioC [Alteromonas macleodii]|jgi:MioC protein|uniref:Flavodoxin family protein n=2 Tax=Alteromonas macleodii TaxID=28108 RepID=A0A126Q6Q4_ALTMA|nr:MULTISPECIES: FMN-binding protein MioC [Alteromonas]AFT80361.1 flavodoxin/nitric oxide synthase [Alteromonas macleodii str. 'Black Sea 11']MEC7510145.1 FMN-binding protein MioC [Pseudomonadota bacterium]NKX17630.1 FMN-binding protein MioC [Alteromonadaceae bacterium A_SAG5]NKX34011.1 FMN-binding protein MioC [Alteromonadaceae bacterium A_SAG3]AFT76588.1 flavodoxin/nitric oxide synthase [Alteromonas macleodii str. 'English Channel 673']|tara:strand:+ start:327 stop:764 length:438 start_codon:yes stop_codon:yes gene_type:complete